MYVTGGGGGGAIAAAAVILVIVAIVVWLVVGMKKCPDGNSDCTIWPFRTCGASGRCTASKGSGGTAPQSCTTNTDCTNPSLSVCDTSSGTCVQCTATSGNCTGGATCTSDNVCSCATGTYYAAPPPIYNMFEPPVAAWRGPGCYAPADSQVLVQTTDCYDTTDSSNWEQSAPDGNGSFYDSACVCEFGPGATYSSSCPNAGTGYCSESLHTDEGTLLCSVPFPVQVGSGDEPPSPTGQPSVCGIASQADAHGTEYGLGHTANTNPTSGVNWALWSNGTPSSSEPWSRCSEGGYSPGWGMYPYPQIGWQSGGPT